ncbi:hypothetical protein NESM_000683900 [Novymonas esmeraldas]|uniref:Uncharacterized protein n=1 Tax=Novymonas esmeraldas TaxID=1808958 RepID=A0AAW0EW52_9TRYP
MFSVAQVDELFASTTRTLQRSLVLLDERRSTVQSQQGLPAVFCVATTSAASTAVSTTAAAPYASTTSTFADTVRSLQSLSMFRAYVEAAVEMAEKVSAEAAAPSAAMQSRRRKGYDFAVLQSLTRGLRGATSAAWRTSSTTSDLWTSAADDGGGAEEAVAADSPLTAAPGTHSGSTRSSGAQLAATLLFASFCVDLAVMAPRTASAVAAELSHLFPPSTAEPAPPLPGCEWARGGGAELRVVLRSIAALLPPPVATRLVARLADLLLRPSPASTAYSVGSGTEEHRRLLGCEQLSGGQLMVPALNYHLLEHYPSSLAARWFVQPLQSAAEHLRADYYASAVRFGAQCRWLLQLLWTLLYACQSAAATATATAAAAASPRPPLERQLRTARRLYDAWLMPVERTFGAGAARHGVSAAFHAALVQPHARLVEQLLRAACGDDAVRTSREWSGVLYSAQYRLLLIVETLAHAEVAQANGTSSTSAQQRTYEAMLRQSGGKVSVPLLQTLAEDRQLVLDVTPSRSPDGHRLYKLHSGLRDDSSGSGRAVFIYVDDGALFTKVGRAGAFQRVKSVEDLFKTLQ